MIWMDMHAIGPEGGEILEDRHLRSMYSAYRWFTRDTLFQSTFTLLSDPRFNLPPDATLDVRVGDIYSSMLMGNLVHTSTVLLRRRVLDIVGKFNIDLLFGEDYDFHLHYSRSAGSSAGLSDDLLSPRQARPHDAP